jgi:HD-GYP domain-containing protein (c-di-GMP phosphodiesterase class II)
MKPEPPLHILISQTLSAQTGVPEELEEQVRYAADTAAGMRELLDTEPDRRTAVLLIVPTGEVAGILKLLEGFSQDSLVYRIVGILPADRSEGAAAFTEQLFDLRSSPPGVEELRFLHARSRSSIAAAVATHGPTPPDREALIDTWHDQDALITIGKTLSLEHNPETLLRTILSLSKKITGADAGSIFLVEHDGEGGKQLRFKYSHTFSMQLDYEEFVMPMNGSSIAGYTAVTGRVLNIADVYRIDPAAPYSFNPGFDRHHGYRTKSMLVVPMRGTNEEPIGVIQLINSKEGSRTVAENAAYEVSLESPEDFETQVYPFKRRYEGLMEAVAGQAAIAIENNRMLKQIEHEFEAFVKASVTAVESRDPATSGHSFRVARMCTNTARAIGESSTRAWRHEDFGAIRLKALEFAGLLHDFGKVYIDPAIFQKEKKLYIKDYENLRLRLHLIRRSLEAGMAEGRAPQEALIEELERIRTAVAELNEPNTQEDHPEQRIAEILTLQQELLCFDPEGRQVLLLTEEDTRNLAVRRGSLNPREREIIESHVEHTYNFVSRIPWPAEFAAIPEITYTHHEKLDGSGYPRGLAGRDAIPLEARIMATADIYDALCAADRPYKPALPRNRVFEILRDEAEAGRIDRDVVEIFISSRAWEIPPELHPYDVKEPGAP